MYSSAYSDYDDNITKHGPDHYDSITKRHLRRGRGAYRLTWMAEQLIIYSSGVIKQTSLSAT